MSQQQKSSRYSPKREQSRTGADKQRGTLATHTNNNTMSDGSVPLLYVMFSAEAHCVSAAEMTSEKKCVSTQEKSDFTIALRFSKRKYRRCAQT